MKILMVEDELRIAQFVCAGLKEQGFLVEHVSNGEDGYERARSTPYDAILLDVMLPGRDGLSVLKALRRDGIATPVLLWCATCRSAGSPVNSWRKLSIYFQR